MFHSKPPLQPEPSRRFEAVQSDPWIPPGVCSPGLFSLSTHHLRELSTWSSGGNKTVKAQLNFQKQVWSRFHSNLQNRHSVIMDECVHL